MFVSVGVIVRTLSDHIDPFQILFFRQIVFVILLTPAITSNIQVLLKPNKISFHILRVSGAFIALYFGFLTVSNLPFADATALGFIQVLFVAAISRLFLSEEVGSARRFTIIVGFIGVMLVVRPTFGGASSLYVLFGVIASLGAAVAVICVRKVAQTEPRITLLAYQAIFVGLIVFVPSMLSWQWPTSNEWILLILVGVISSIAQWIGITAYKWGEANVVANVEYVKIIYSLLIGYWLFSEIPDIYALAGTAIIIASVVMPNLAKLRQKKTIS
ncbi:DMT family transporter [Vibrio sp. DW001]|uniref:DMT family transporter n=1 Tax=Vibrio sp. DW001 TaxID=2912315 RepID=UPI0023AFEE1A|nr:DMT family transporter [Vibrio sp. DW001]WED29975.1 DMT family transporter [Vibrio sp. DW001]